MLVGDGEVDLRRHAGRGDLGEPPGGAAGQLHGRLAGGEIDHAHVPPEHTGAKAGAQRLGAGFLRRETLGVARGALRPRLGLPLLDRREHPVDEAPAETVERPLDPTDVDDVAADAYDHGGQALRSPAVSARAWSMRARMRRIALSSPPKIASPIRKWPIFSSTMVAIAATAPTVS